jgi:hypothetical protein
MQLLISNLFRYTTYHSCFLWIRDCISKHNINFLLRKLYDATFDFQFFWEFKYSSQNLFFFQSTKKKEKLNIGKSSVM